jgi:SAM-dependent methyltransferase
MAMPERTSPYDDHAIAYAAYVTQREAAGREDDPMGILPYLLGLLGEVNGRSVLDAGCGEGYLARVLAARGAHVTGIDLSPRLIDLARARDPAGAIRYSVADLSQPLPDEVGRYDAVASYMVLNDIEDERGFAATLTAALRSGGRLVLAFNSPYSIALRKQGVAYCDSTAVCPCGLARIGVPVPVYHRALEAYLDAFLDAGLHLAKLVDVPPVVQPLGRPDSLSAEDRVPRFMLLAFTKP